MKTRLPALCLVGAVAAVTLAVAAHARGPKDSPVAPQENGPPSKGSTSRRAPSTMREFMAILEETQSVDTFLLTTSALSELGPRAKPAIRAIIRNAERLKVLENHTKQAVPSAERMRCAQQVHQAIVRILKGDQPGYYGPVSYVQGPFVAPPVVYPVTAPCPPPASLPPTRPTTANAPNPSSTSGCLSTSEWSLPR